ncbi:MAG: prepilin peptidase [Bryobacteraceae bacterium]|jgi:leader peptidase (prepilin peptidase)/N-methyltransferase
MMEALFAFLFGLAIGSFLNVCIYRWPRDLSVVRPRSHCPACEKTIAWYDNIPLLSYALLGGRCRHCRARISIRYPVVELTTGLLFAYFALQGGPILAALKMCVFAAILTGLVFSDLEERILPDEFTLGGTLAGLAFAGFVPTGISAGAPESSGQILYWILGVNPSARVDSLLESVLGAALPAAFLWAGGWLFQKIRHREGLGLGDVKLVAMAGSFLGLRGALFTLFVGSLAGSILGYGYIRFTHKDPATYELPFGTFLGAAALLVTMAGPGMLP